MSTKGKGTRAERELFHMFWETGSFIGVRSAGSGSTPIPNPDLIVGNGEKTFAIECKALKSGSKYFPKKEIDELRSEQSKVKDDSQVSQMKQVKEKIKNVARGSMYVFLARTNNIFPESKNFSERENSPCLREIPD